MGPLGRLLVVAIRVVAWPLIGLITDAPVAAALALVARRRDRRLALAVDGPARRADGRPLAGPRARLDRAGAHVRRARPRGRRRRACPTTTTTRSRTRWSSCWSGSVPARAASLGRRRGRGSPASRQVPAVVAAGRGRGPDRLERRPPPAGRHARTAASRRAAAAATRIAGGRDRTDQSRSARCPSSRPPRPTLPARSATGRDRPRRGLGRRPGDRLRRAVRDRDRRPLRRPGRGRLAGRPPVRDRRRTARRTVEARSRRPTVDVEPCAGSRPLRARCVTVYAARPAEPTGRGNRERRRPRRRRSLSPRPGRWRAIRVVPR